MAWKDARGSTHVVVSTVRHVAHSDDAKSRTHDASQLARKGFPRKLLVGGTSLGLVVAAVVVALAVNGRGDDPPRQIAAVGGTSVSAAPSPSSEPAVASPEDVMAQSQPSGVWKAQTIGRFSINRAGARKKTTYKDKATRWTLTSSSCTADGCTGTIASTSGNSFVYQWSGQRLVVTREDETFVDKKRACVDLDTGEVMPIAQSAARVTYHYVFGAFHGTGGTMTSRVTTTFTYEFFGDCHATPDDTMTYLEDQVITQANPS
jgi:hypothetical protein